MSPLSRLLLFLSIAFAVSVAGLWISGGKREEYSARIDIDRKPDQIWQYLVEPEKLKNWMTGLEQIDRPLEPPGAYKEPPELLRTVVNPNGKRVQYNDFVIRYKEDEVLTVQSSASGTVQTTILQLEPFDSGTQFSYSVKVSHNNLARLMAPLQSSKLQERVSADVRKLKELVEQSEPKLPDEVVPADPPKDKTETEKPPEEPAEKPVDMQVPDVSRGDEEGL